MIPLTVNTAETVFVRRKPSPGARMAGPFLCDFTKDLQYAIDTGDVQRSEKIPFIQSVFLDLTESPCPVEISDETGSIVQQLPGRWQGWLPLPIGPQRRLLVRSTWAGGQPTANPAGAATVYLANWTVEGAAWRSPPIAGAPSGNHYGQTPLVAPRRVSMGQQAVVAVSGTFDVCYTVDLARVIAFQGVLYIPSATASFAGIAQLNGLVPAAAWPVDFTTGADAYIALPQVRDLALDQLPLHNLSLLVTNAPATFDATLTYAATLELP